MCDIGQSARSSHGADALSCACPSLLHPPHARTHLSPYMHPLPISTRRRPREPVERVDKGVALLQCRRHLRVHRSPSRGSRDRLCPTCPWRWRRRVCAVEGGRTAGSISARRRARAGGRSVRLPTRPLFNDGGSRLWRTASQDNPQSRSREPRAHLHSRVLCLGPPRSPNWSRGHVRRRESVGGESYG